VTWNNSKMRRYMPWILVGGLAMVTALAIGLGLAEAPVTGRTALARLGSPSPKATPTTGSVPITSTTTTIGAQPCNADSLQLATAEVNTDAPSTLNQGALTLLNQSPAPCELSTTPVFEIVGTTGVVMATTGPGKVVNDLIRPGHAQGANLNWQNWCGADLRPLALHVILPSGGGVLSRPYGDASTMLPKCTDSSLPSNLFAHGSGGPGTLFGLLITGQLPPGEGG
jgi:hypothetical protein